MYSDYTYPFILFLEIYGVFIMTSYVVLGFISVAGLREYLRKNSFVNYDVLLTSEYAPKLSLLAPAYNESLTIQENIKSLLSLNYSDYEVIVINDGSKDNTMELLQSVYNLELSTKEYTFDLETKEVLGVYRSKIPVYKNLIVVDKVNGGKADALNVGVNIASNPYVVCIDVDCILEKNALLKLVKPFLEATDKRVIATGGVIRIANGCTIEDGVLTKVNVPKKLLPRIQVIEYLRAFLLGRVAWAKLDGLLLISGAFGAFDKEIVKEVGGYDSSTVGEDMELVVRMSNYMLENKEPYSVSFIPDPLCWTEAPEKISVFKKQRSRWMRGSIETMWRHRKMFFNPKYKILGLLSYPYWLFCELFAPLIETLGGILTIIYVVLGILNWYTFFLFYAFVYSFAVMFSLFALLSEEYTYHKYLRKRDYAKLLLGAIVEPFYTHPLGVFSAVFGYYEKIKGTKSWGEMTRTGFSVEEDNTKELVEK